MHTAVGTHPAPLKARTMPDAGELSLPDGTCLRYRPTRAADAPLLQAFHRTLSAETVYQAYHGVLPALSDARADAFAAAEPHRLALVAHDPARSDALLALARYEGAAGADHAELALVVADRVQGRGLGFALLGRLVAAARRRDIRVLRGTVMAENRPMLRLLRNLALPHHARIDHGYVTVELTLASDAGAAELHCRAGPG